MEQIGSQVKLPLSTAFNISLQGIKIRLNRALVTLSGVVLGIAFLMSVLTGNLISDAVSQEKQARQTVKAMMSILQSEIGTIEGKALAVAVVGELNKTDESFLNALVKEKPAEIRGHGLPEKSGIANTPLEGIGDGASIVLVLGSGNEMPVSPEALTEGMAQPFIMDSLDGRQYSDASAEEIRIEPFIKSNVEETEKLAAEAKQAKFRTLWILIISLLVTVIGITNALLMSVTERFKEIGTMKCLGALSSFIRRLFVIESALIGFVGSVIGIVVGALFPMIAYGITFGFGPVFGSLNYPQVLLASAVSLVVGTLLSIIAAIYPATFASRMVPAMALRSNV